MNEFKYVQIVNKYLVDENILKQLQSYGVQCVFEKKKIWFELYPHHQWDKIWTIFSKHEINYYITEHQWSLKNVDIAMEYFDLYNSIIQRDYARRRIRTTEFKRYEWILDRTVSRSIERNAYIEHNFPLYFNEACKEKGLPNICIFNRDILNGKPK